MTRILYIIGKGRSGTTLIDNVLGQIPGVVSTGELNKLFTWGFDEKVKCGCGLEVPNCPFWKDVLDVAWGGDPPIERMVRLQRRVQRWANLPRLLGKPPVNPSGWDDLDELASARSRLYSAISEVASAELVVDSSKWPAEPAPLGLVPDADVRLLHVVRDPRAVVNSWKRKKGWDDREGQMPRYGVVYSMASYWARNLVTEVVVRRHPKKWMRLRYEDFVASPRLELERILKLCDLDPTLVPVSDNAEVEMQVCHTAGGNPGRMRTGTITIEPDERWTDEMNRFVRTAATALGLPFLIRYRYWRPHR